MVNFNLIDDSQDLKIELLDDNNEIEFSMTDYDDTEIKNEINEIQTQVDSNTANISNLSDRVDDIPIVTKTSQLTNDSGFITSAYHDNTKQDKLISGSNIKTVNNQSLLGSGNIVIESGAGSYPDLTNKPKINNVELVGNKSLNDLGIQPQGNYALASDIPTQLSQLTNDETHRTVTDEEIQTWNAKADIGFYGIIDGTNANPTDGASLLNGVYKVDESKTTSYINLPMEDGITKKQSVQKGGIVIRTNARLVILATQNLMYQYDVSQHFFYPAEPFVESTLRREFVDGIADLGTITPPNTYYMTLPISYLSATVNTGDSGHTRLTFTVEEGIEKGDFELYLTDTEGNDLLYKDGIVPQPVAGETWIFEIYGNTCETLRFTDTAVAEVVNYNDVTNKPVVSHKTTSIESRTVTVGTTNTTIQGTQAIDTLTGFQFIPLDMSSYTSGAANKALIPETHLPAGVYIVTVPGYMRLGSDTKQLDVGTIIYWRGIQAGGELDIMGYNACEYWGYDSQNDEWSGGYFTTEDDVRYIAAEIANWEIANSNVATGTVAMNDGTWYRRYRPAGITKLTFNFPETVEHNYKSRVTCKTASTFSEFVVGTEDYEIYFYGDDCSNGVLTGVPDKYYDIQARGDGFGGVIVEVHSHPLSTT